MKSTVIILGTSRSNGNTEMISNKVARYLDADVINLLDYEIGQYDYEHQNASDDFIPLIGDIVEKYEYIIFATPVYWYAMSGIMKVFFDRLTDVITIRKDLGRMLRGKKAAVITSSIGNHLEEEFWLPFDRTFGYLGMQFIMKKHFIEDQITDEELLNLF